MKTKVVVELRDAVLAEETIKSVIDLYGEGSVYGLIMPLLKDRNLEDKEIVECEKVANKYKLDYTILPIDNIVNEYRKWLGDLSEKREQSLTDSIRDAILKDYSIKLDERK